MLGRFLSIWEAQSKWENLRVRGGGGVVTTLLAYAMEKGMIDNALVVRDKNKEPWAEPMIAETVDDIFAAAGSKYIFVPYHQIINRLGERSAIVGVPCQISSIKKPQILKIGLFDGLTISIEGMHYLLRQLKINPQDIDQFDYRTPGGGLFVKMKDGQIIKYTGYSWLAYFFTLPRCLHCQDNTNHNADISIGDRCGIGFNNVIIRTKRGEELFLSALRDGYILGRQLSIDDFFSKIQTPFYWKEIRGGYWHHSYVKKYNAWIHKVPLPILRFFGRRIMKDSLNQSKRYFQMEHDGLVFPYVKNNKCE